MRLNELLQIESFLPATSETRDTDRGFLQGPSLTIATGASGAQAPKLEVYPSPLTNILDCPVYIPQLYFRLRILLSNLWNEFICNYDPSMAGHRFETPSPTSSESSYNDDPKQELQISSLTQLMAVLLISFVAIVTDFFKGYYATKSHPLIKIRFLSNLVKREVRKRNITCGSVWRAFSNSLNPVQIVKLCFTWTWWAIITVSLMWPYWAYREVVAFRCCYFLGRSIFYFNLNSSFRGSFIGK